MHSATRKTHSLWRIWKENTLQQSKKLVENIRNRLNKEKK